MKKQETSSGFTLIEILIAIFIFSIIVTTIFGSFTSVFSSAKMIDEDIDAYEMAKNCFDRMILDLRSVRISSEFNYIRPGIGTDNPPDPYRIVGDISYAETGSFSRIRFTSQTHLPLEKSTQDGIAEIVYYVQSTDDDSYVLRRADSLYPYKRFEGKVFEEKRLTLYCVKISSLWKLNIMMTKRQNMIIGTPNPRSSNMQLPGQYG